MPRSKPPLPKCCVCGKALEFIIGDEEVIRVKTPPFKMRGWQKRKTREWLCPDSRCKHLFLTPKEEPYQNQEKPDPSQQE